MVETLAADTTGITDADGLTNDSYSYRWLADDNGAARLQRRCAVVLPVTTKCGAQGAICTKDGRKLSNSLNFTVSGPNQ